MTPPCSLHTPPSSPLWALPCPPFYSPKHPHMHLQACQLFLSDFPLHDMGREFVLLAEQRSAEAELKV